MADCDGCEFEYIDCQAASQTNNIICVWLTVSKVATSYIFNMSTGITYRFGSKYNNVLNPRISTSRL